MENENLSYEDLKSMLDNYKLLGDFYKAKVVDYIINQMENNDAIYEITEKDINAIADDLASDTEIENAILDNLEYSVENYLKEDM